MIMNDSLPEPTAANTPRTILVVDDNPTNLKLAITVLESEGYQVLKAQDAEEALTVLRGFIPDLILMDIALPGMDGLTLTEKLRADPATARIRIVAMTAFAMQGDEQKALDAGCNGYIAKPIDTRRLPVQVAEYLQEQPKQRGRLNVLIVDDVSMNRKLLSATLKTSGCNLVEACDGVEALAILEHQPVDAIISDVLMPTMDGYRLCYEVRKSDRFRSLPFIFYSSTDTAASDEKLAMDLGADRFIPKPASAEVLLGALAEVTGRPRPSEPHAIAPPRELELMKQYSQRLVVKLEQQNSQLRKQAETLRENEIQLRESERQTRQQYAELEQLHRVAPIGLALLDPDLRILRINERLAEMNGRPVDVHIGRTLDEVAPELAPAIVPLFQQIFTTGRPILDREVHGTTLAQPGVERDWLVSYFPLTSENGTVIAASAVVQEITERKRTETDLRESEARLRLLVHASNIGLWDWNLLTDEVFFSREWKSQLGYAEHELSNRYQEWESRLHSDDRAQALEITREFREGIRDNYDIEFRLRHKDGSWRWILSRADMIHDSDGRPIRMMGCHVDITERKQSEEMFREREQQLRLFIEHSPASIAMLDHEMQYLVTSRRWLADYRLGEQDLTGRNHYDVFPEIAEPWKEIHRRCLGGAIETCDEEAFVRADGNTDWIRWEIRPWHKAQGEIGGLIIFSEVITERKQAAEALRESQTVLQLVLDSIPHGVFWKDRNSVYLGANRVSRHAMGLETPQSVVGLTDFDIPSFRREQAEFFVYHDREVMQSGQPKFGIVEAMTLPNDTTIWLTTNKMPMHDAAGNVTGILGTWEDITERKRAADALQRSEQRFRALIENSFDAITLNSPDGTILYASPSAARVLGYSAAELTGTNAYALLHPDDIARIKVKMRRVAATSSILATDVYRVQQKDGSRRWIEVMVTNLLDDPNVEAIVCNLRDISERQRSHDELRASRERLAALSRQLIETQESERRHLARELHDEIGQALTAIKLNLNALQQLDLVAKPRSLVQETISVVDQTLRQVRTLALDLRPSMLDDIGLVAALRWCLDRQSQRASFSPNFVGDSSVRGASKEIETACFRIAQESLTNIARHAKARNVRIELHQKDNELELVVTDDGVGFDVPAARDRAASGASIGLLGMEERVLLVGGQLVIESIPSCGTTIRARFPSVADSSS